MDAWHIFEWVWAAVLFTYLAAQVIAFRRLDGERKRISSKVLIAIVVLVTISNFVHAVFEIRAVSTVGMIVVGIAAVIATVVLVRMLRAKEQCRGLTAES
jgi:heme A synthase